MTEWLRVLVTLETRGKTTKADQFYGTKQAANVRIATTADLQWSFLSLHACIMNDGEEIRDHRNENRGPEYCSDRKPSKILAD